MDRQADGKAKIAGVILAGGLSSRMGEDKAHVRLGGATLLEHAIRRLAPQVDGLAVNANGPVAESGNLPVFPDLGPRAGPLGGILAALDHTRRTRPDVSHVATVPVDSPFFPADLVARLADGWADLAVARSRTGLHPVFALWPVALRDDLAAWLKGGDSRRVRLYLGHHRAREVDFPEIETPRGPFDPFVNLNTPAERDEAEGWLKVLEP